MVLCKYFMATLWISLFNKPAFVVTPYLFIILYKDMPSSTTACYRAPANATHVTVGARCPGNHPDGFIPQLFGVYRPEWSVSD